jgi:Leucine-rich repeat (LRR) protein
VRLANNAPLTRLPVAELINWTNLRHLSGQSNQLTDLPKAITELVKLETLNLDNNRITCLPEGIGQLHNLIELTLSNNQLKSLPSSIVKLKFTLNILDLRNNPNLAILEQK